MKTSGPFGILPASAIFDERMSNALLRVLAALTTYADENRICRPSQKTLGERLHRTRQAVGKSIEQLVVLGYLEKIHRFRENGSKASNEYRILFDQEGVIPMQPHVASPMQLYVAPMQPHVAWVGNPTLPTHATSEVASRTDHIEQTKILRGTVDIDVAVIGASPPVADADLSSLCAQIAKASRATLDPHALKHLIEQHPTLDAKRLVFETEMAATWIADPTRNKRKRTMTVQFLHGWYKREEQPQEETHGTNSNGTYSAGANGRGQGTRSAPASAPAHAAQPGERERDPRFPDPFKRTQERLAAFR